MWTYVSLIPVSLHFYVYFWSSYQVSCLVMIWLIVPGRSNPAPGSNCRETALVILPSGEGIHGRDWLSLSYSQFPDYVISSPLKFAPYRCSSSSLSSSSVRGLLGDEDGGSLSIFSTKAMAKKKYYNDFPCIFYVFSARYFRPVSPRLCNYCDPYYACDPPFAFPPLRAIYSR